MEQRAQQRFVPEMNHLELSTLPAPISNVERPVSTALGPREQVRQVLLWLHARVRPVASLVTVVPREGASHVPVHAFGMSLEHIDYGLGFYIPSSAEFAHSLEHRHEIHDWDSFDNFRASDTAREHLVRSGYSQGTSFGLFHQDVLVGSVHLNVSHTEHFSSSTLEAIARARDHLVTPVSALANSLRTGLSRRELEVLRELALGRSNKEIADHLLVARYTVNTHIEHVFQKLGASNRVQAALTARDLGLV